jgi:hypothetical protein
MVRDTNLSQRPDRQGTTKCAELKGNGLKFRVISRSSDNRVEELLKLEAENAELRRRAADLVLEIHALRSR